MHIRNLSQKFEISFVIKDSWHLPVHKHTHYELQFIIKGSGQHIINDQTYNYKKGDLFILPPQDTHFFIFNERTAIGVIKFHEGFFEDFLQDADFKQLLTRFSSPNRKVNLSGSNREQVIKLMELVISEHRKVTAYQNFIIKSSLALVLALMSKDSELNVVPLKEEKIQTILNFIDQHITEKRLLSIPKMAEQFNISKAYFNQYFTKATGSTFKKYVQTYALNLIAHQLVHRDKTLSELAYEYGYSDESHLSNAFKAHFGVSPSAFKNANPA
ncbi:AraC family transcriptional regulator [Mucilaginibacter sp. X4EP1]|uniref:AraC family transcriptional regulator n=1 Tax=Mucilaginibacter sp. X4EP1 TaxID=2723092 RepID=UPI0021689C08|nr:AraC family transcriptional regulator [Mucilaginibacter sp. X4EP1]MCS3812694.1 AraC-like DNA-binding protein [Mucilaginibacter sp. X4EP1]